MGTRKKSCCRSKIEGLTLRAIFFSLFIAENCLSRERIAGSRALSGATPFSQIHGWPEEQRETRSHMTSTQTTRFPSRNMAQKPILSPVPTEMEKSKEGRLTEDFMGFQSFSGARAEHLPDEIFGAVRDQRPRI